MEDVVDANVYKKLYNLYYESKGKPSFLTGDAKIFLNQYRDEKFKPQIKLHDVEKFLSKQSVYGLHRKQVNKFERNPIYTMFQGDVFALDLKDMSAFSSQNDNYKYILVGIDTFSKKGYATPLLYKKPTYILEGFKKIMKGIDYPIRNICVDNGTEFLGDFKTWCGQNRINLYTVEGETKNSIVERFIETLTKRLWRYLRYIGKHQWVDILPDLIETYNETKHSTIKMPPNSVNNGNSHIVYKILYPGRYIKKPPVFKVGDAVRHSIKIGDRNKSYEGSYTIQIFLIKKIKYNIRGKHPVYKLEEAYSKKEYPGYWYKEQLLKVDKETFASKDTLYDVQVLRTKGRKALVKYVGYDDKPHWEENSSLVQDFRKKS